MTKFTRYTVNREKERFHKESFWDKINFKKSLNLRSVVLGLIMLVGFVYLVQTNRVSTGGFKIDELTQRAEELKKGNKKLELESALLQSTKTIEESSKGMNLVSVSKMEYVTLPPSAVALANK